MQVGWQRAVLPVSPIWSPVRRRSTERRQPRAHQWRWLFQPRVKNEQLGTITFDLGGISQPIC